MSHKPKSCRGYLTSAADGADEAAVLEARRELDSLKQRLAESFEAALRVAGGRALAVEINSTPGNESVGQSPKEHLFNAKFSCKARWWTLCWPCLRTPG